VDGWEPRPRPISFTADVAAVAAVAALAVAVAVLQPPAAMGPQYPGDNTSNIGIIDALLRSSVARAMW
jgi:hypothetical protein